MNPPVTYVPGFFDEFEAHHTFEDLLELAWVQNGDLPRREYYVNSVGTPYTYGRAPFAKTYQPMPETMRLRLIRERVEAYLKTKFEVCFLNRYDDQSKRLGWHSDNSPEMDDARPIAILSLGVARDIRFRLIPPPEEAAGGDSYVLPHINLIHPVTLEPGSLCVMAPGMQDTWQHEIPKSGRACGTRISLTFRGYVPTKVLP